MQSRSQRHVQVLGIDATTGATELLAEQRDDAWVTLVDGLPDRTAAGILLTSGDIDDTRSLLADGEPVTPPGLQLNAVLAVDGETVLFTASDEPTQGHVWAWDRASGTRRLSDEPGLHSGTQRGGTTVLTSRTLDRPGTRTTVQKGSASGRGPAKRALVQIASCAQRPVLDLRREMLSLGPRELRAALFLPSWYRPADGPLPVLMDPYGGPAMRKVTADQSPDTFVSQWFAEQGFAVLVADGVGTPGRGAVLGAGNLPGYRRAGAQRPGNGAARGGPARARAGPQPGRDRRAHATAVGRAACGRPAARGPAAAASDAPGRRASGGRPPAAPAGFPPADGRPGPGGRCALRQPCATGPPRIGVADVPLSEAH